MTAAIRMPPFPLLRWDGYMWSGNIRLRSWAKFMGILKWYLLTVDAEDKAFPTPEQAAAFRHLLDNQASIAEAVARALLEYYPEAREGYYDAFDGDDPDEELPEVVDLAGLKPLIGLTFVHILSVSRDGVAYVGFELGCKWDTEHGAGVLTHCGRVVATGQASESFTGGAARKDAKRAEPLSWPTDVNKSDDPGSG